MRTANCGLAVTIPLLRVISGGPPLWGEKASIRVGRLFLAAVAGVALRTERHNGQNVLSLQAEYDVLKHNPTEKSLPLVCGKKILRTVKSEGRKIKPYIVNSK